MKNIPFVLPVKTALGHYIYEVNKNEILSIVGPSGCGKSTILSILTNLEEKSDGDMGMVTVYINGDINPNESVDLINYSDLDLTKATNIKYELIQE